MRAVPKAEHLLHLILGICILGVSGRIFKGDVTGGLPWLGAFGVFGLIDEFVFHRVVPAIEADCHAKEHLLFFLFVVVGIGPRAPSPPPIQRSLWSAL